MHSRHLYTYYLQISTTRSTDKTMRGHIGIRGPPLLAFKTFLVVGKGCKFSQTLKEKFFFLSFSSHFGKDKPELLSSCRTL